jgi:hypothetical protein
MGKIVTLPENFIGKEDRERLESFGGHTVAHGRATRWNWRKDSDGDDVFEIYRGGDNEILIARINRDRKRDTFCARDATGGPLVSGSLEHVFAQLDAYFARMHGEEPGAPA